jgi:ABC-type bacteriocin/lantibiotic exporter with double-glycine peptidase domain
MPNILLPVPHHRQHHNADCLAACAAMVLAYLKITIGYDQLLKLLKVRPYGTAGQNLKYLQSLDVQVIYREGSLIELKASLETGTPWIVLVSTEKLSYWSYSTDHALVVTGFDEQSIYVNDPAFVKSPLAIPVAEFELAWMVFDYRYSAILPTEENQ